MYHQIIAHGKFLIFLQSHLDINLHDTSAERARESINYLEEFISAQQCPLNLWLVFPNRSRSMLIKVFKSKLESFQRLELVKWSFTGCDWNWLNDCPNLTEFAITNSHTLQVAGILGTKHETYRLKQSKNSKILTEHWHFDKDNETSSMPKFYFHSGKTPMVPYGGEPPILIQPKVHHTISKEKLLQYKVENLFKQLDRFDREEFRRRYDDYDYDSDENGYNNEDDFDYEDYFGMSPERFYECYDPSD